MRQRDRQLDQPDGIAVSARDDNVWALVGWDWQREDIGSIGFEIVEPKVKSEFRSRGGDAADQSPKDKVMPESISTLSQRSETTVEDVTQGLQLGAHGAAV